MPLHILKQSFISAGRLTLVSSLFCLANFIVFQIGEHREQGSVHSKIARICTSISCNKDQCRSQEYFCTCVGGARKAGGRWGLSAHHLMPGKQKFWVWGQEVTFPVSSMLQGNAGLVWCGWKCLSQTNCQELLESYTVAPFPCSKVCIVQNEWCTNDGCRCTYCCLQTWATIQEHSSTGW